MKSVPPKKSDRTLMSFPIVAIGASAGGAQSFQEMLYHLPANTGMAYVYVQHMDSDHDGNLVELFQRSSKVQILEGKESTRLAPNQVFVIPPNRKMRIVDGK